MTVPDSSDPRVLFDYFSGEYAQALQAFTAIEQQAGALLVMGHNDELRTFINQFIEMATRTRDAALEKNEPNFAEWFSELVTKAEGLKTTVPK